MPSQSDPKQSAIRDVRIVIEEFIRRASIANQWVVRVALIVAATSAAVACQADEPLRWQFTAGRPLEYEVSQVVTMSLKSGTGEVWAKAAQTINLTWNIQSVDQQESAKIEQKINRIRMKTFAGIGGQLLGYDSQSNVPVEGANARFAAMAKAVLAGGITFKMSPHGSVSDLEVSADMLAAAKDRPDGGEVLVQQVKSIISQIGFPLPETEPEPGEEWKTKMKLKRLAGIDETVETVYRYEGVRNADGTIYAVIKPNLKLQLGTNPMGLKFNEQKTVGEALFDLGAGRLHAVSITHTAAQVAEAGGNKTPGTLEQQLNIKVPSNENNANEEVVEGAESGPAPK
jgi:hypothetical protein